MARKRHYDPKKVKGNFGPGGFSDQYDNSKMRSMDHDQNPGGITGIPFEDEIDLDEIKFSPEKGEAFLSNHLGPEEPDRSADLGVGRSGTNWNWDLDLDKKVISDQKAWKISDIKLKEKVVEVLMHSHDVDPSNLEVSVKDQVVYLKGYIESDGMKSVAEDLILSIPGVEEVFTDLKILNSGMNTNLM